MSVARRRARSSVIVDGSASRGKTSIPCCRDPVGVPAGSELASPQLEDAEGARLALGRPRGGEADDGVGDGELGRDGDLVLGVLADPERGRPGTAESRPARSCRKRRKLGPRPRTPRAP